MIDCELAEAIESRLLSWAASTPFWGRLDRLGEPSKETRASSPNGFSVAFKSLDESYGLLYAWSEWTRFERRVFDEAIEEGEGLRGVRVVCSESIASNEYSSEKTLGFEVRPEVDWRCIGSVS